MSILYTAARETLKRFRQPLIYEGSSSITIRWANQGRIWACGCHRKISMGNTPTLNVPLELFLLHLNQIHTFTPVIRLKHAFLFPFNCKAVSYLFPNSKHYDMQIPQICRWLDLMLGSSRGSGIREFSGCLLCRGNLTSNSVNALIFYIYYLYLRKGLDAD